MTLVTLPAPIAWPDILAPLGQPTLATAITLDAAGEYIAGIFCAAEAMTISHVSFRTGTVTVSGTAEVIVSIEGVAAATGLPDGAATYGGSASAATTVTSNANPIIALGGAATVAKGQIFAVKIAYSSGTSIIVQQINNTSVYRSLPYQVLNTGTPTKFTISTSAMTIAVGSSATAFYYLQGTLPLSASAAGAFNNTNSAKRGLRFVIPMNCRAVGLRNYQNTSVGDFNAVLYNDAGTELSSSSTAFEGDVNSASNNGSGDYYFDNSVTLTGGTAYRIAIEPSSATTANVWTLTLPSADFFGATPARATAVYTSFATATWTDSTTQLPVMDLLIDQVDDGTGSGSGGGGQRVISG